MDRREFVARELSKMFFFGQCTCLLKQQGVNVDDLSEMPSPEDNEVVRVTLFKAETEWDSFLTTADDLLEGLHEKAF